MASTFAWDRTNHVRGSKEIPGILVTLVTDGRSHLFALAVLSRLQ
eukprot:COSAG03_NODE_528_length_7143_cov_7.192930_8_plen_45_part_00